MTIVSNGASMHGLTTSSDVIARLRGRLRECLEPFDPGKASYALLDFPNHSNVGDSAIWLGEINHLKRVWRTSPAYVCDAQDVDWADLDRAVPDGTIFIHGGGNFGDLWPLHQTFREEVLRRFPGRPVVQLPQTVHFESRGLVDRAARAIAEHGNFTLFVRDEESFEFARGRFDCHIHLAPDTAFALGPLKRRKSPDVEALLLLRTDKEASAMARGGSFPRSDIATLMADWVEDEPPTRWERRLHSIRSKLKSGNELQKSNFEQLAKARVARGIRLLSRGQRVVTDRLHGHILCTLLGIDHVIVDNNYGKIRRFVDTWHTDWRGVRFAEDLRAALEFLKD